MVVCVLFMCVCQELCICPNNYSHLLHLFVRLEDQRPIERFLLALAEGPSGPFVKRVTNGLSQESPSGICVLSDLCILDVTDLLIC